MFSHFLQKEAENIKRHKKILPADKGVGVTRIVSGLFKDGNTETTQDAATVSTIVNPTRQLGLSGDLELQLEKCPLCS